MDDKVFAEIFDGEDEIYRARLILTLSDRAKELGIKTKFDSMLKAHKKVFQELSATKSYDADNVCNWTMFTGPYEPMKCGSWIAHDGGIFKQTNDTENIQACYHPILPLERMKNLETGEEHIKIAYKRKNKWYEIVVPKSVVASARTIVGLAEIGISVTSENAKYLVRYLADVENMNESEIEVIHSTSKLGYIKDYFIPYDQDIIFDGKDRFKNIFESICQVGDKEEWYKHVKKIRKHGKLEIKTMLAASFASVLVGKLQALPFFVDLWGKTEGGKSVTLMLAASVWANPDESQYIGDFKTTDVALEARADVLNNLPMILDDTSKTSAKLKDNFEGMVYDLCSGKGKSRSNKAIGLNRENRWRLSILTTGEQPLQSYVNQGGAINRILSVKASNRIFEDARHTVDIVKNNYGFAGKDFIEVLKKIDIDEVKRIQEDFYNIVMKDGKMQKQCLSLSVLLTADLLIEKYLFKDGCLIQSSDYDTLLTNDSEVSDNERAFKSICDLLLMNRSKFFQDDLNYEKWGVVDCDRFYIYTQDFRDLCKKVGVSFTSFVDWCIENGKMICNPGRKNYAKKINGKYVRLIYLEIPFDENEEEFSEPEEEIPFEQ